MIRKARPTPPARNRHRVESRRAGVASALAVVLFVLLVLVPVPLAADDDEKPATETASPSTPASPAPAAGWRIYRDPETGRLLSAPLPGQAESLAAKWDRRRALSAPVDRPRTFPVVLDGRTVGTGVALEGRFVTSTVLRRRGDGTAVLECSDHPHSHPTPDAAPAAPER